MLATRQPPKKLPGQGCGPRTVNGAVLDVRSGAAFIGGTEKQLRALIARRRVPFRRLGGRIIFLREELASWMAGLPGCTPAEARQNLGEATR